MSEPGEHSGAFPMDIPDIGWLSRGLTKRELFAAMAMQGLYAGYYAHKDGVRAVTVSADLRGIDCAQMIAEASVQGADRLLQELAK